MINGISTSFKIWGLNCEEIYVDGDLWWRIWINNPFYVKDKGWFIGLNIKLFREAWKTGVRKFILMIDNTEQLMDIPNKKYLKLLESRGEFQDIPSQFENSKPMRIYWFRFRPQRTTEP
jgi:hypothetical protein